MNIRCGLESDYESVENIAEEGQEYHVKIRPDMYKVKNMDPFISINFYNELVKNNQVFVAENAQGIVMGYIICVQRCKETEYLKGYKTLFIDSIAVKEEYRKQGIAREMILWAIDYAKEMKSQKIELQVNAKNTIAMSLYLNAGFNEKSINMEMYID